jgi:hypothetical protein
MSAVCCFIKEQYFIDHASFAKMLDPGNTGKQSHRTYLCLKITSDGNDYYIPLRNNPYCLNGIALNHLLVHQIESSYNHTLP